MADSDLSFRCYFSVPSGLTDEERKTYVLRQLARLTESVDNREASYLDLFATLYDDSGSDVGRFAVKRADYR